MASQVEATVLKIGQAPFFLDPQSWSFPTSEIAMEEVIDGDINASIMWNGNIYYVSETLADLVTAANDGGGGGVTIYTGDGSLSGDRIIDLNGKKLSFIADADNHWDLDPVAQSFFATFTNSGNSVQEAANCTDSSPIWYAAANVGVTSAVVNVAYDGDSGTVLGSFVATDGVSNTSSIIVKPTEIAITGDTILSNLAGGGVTGVSIDNDGKLIRTP